MIIKEEPKNKEIVTKVVNIIVKKRKQILKFSYILLAIALLFAGILLGLLITESSKILDGMGINYTETREFAVAVKDQNIRIPLNYIKSIASNPDKIYIDIAFKDYQKLAYKREKALETGILRTEDDAYVPATLRYNNTPISAKVRLKGDWAQDHLEGDKWSLRINIKGDETLFGMETFSIQRPETRNFLNEVVFQKALEREGIISLRTKFIEVIINGDNKGIYELEESFEKYLIENNRLREGPIIKFNEDLLWGKVYRDNTLDPEDLIKDTYLIADIDSFKTSSVLNDPIKYEQYLKAKNLLESFRQDKLETKQVFDIDKLSKFFALSQVMGARHGLTFHNARFYYNPVTSLLEPIGFDGGAGTTIPTVSFDDPMFSQEYFDQFFKDKEFFEKYVQELNRMSEPSYLDNLFSEMNQKIKSDLNIIHKDYLLYDFTTHKFYNNQRIIKNYINPVKAIQPHFYNKENGKFTIEVANIQEIPIIIKSVTYNGTINIALDNDVIIESRAADRLPKYEKVEFIIPHNITLPDDFERNLKINHKLLGMDVLRSEDVFPWANLNENFLEGDITREAINVGDFNFLVVGQNTVTIKPGYHIVNKSIIFPAHVTVLCNEGVTLDLKNQATLLSRSAFQCVGSEENPIKIISSDGSGGGIFVLNAEETSYFRNVIFDKLSAPAQKGWELTGSLTFYESPVKFNNVRITNGQSEDALNVIRAEVIIENSIFDTSLSDCFDGDFIEGKIIKSSFIKCGDDAIDVSGSKFEVHDTSMYNIGDKALSVGENSELQANNIKIDGSFIGIASKDLSIVTISNIVIRNSTYGFVAYQKKSEFGPASIIAEEYQMQESDPPHLQEVGSIISINGDMITAELYDVYEIYLENDV